ncbi:MAG: undecaprenyl-diphosphatase UppP [Myxococcales bacterium]|nr:undecaprenyl-diphosphatase UppP [Myxococcales bacterium]
MPYWFAFVMGLVQGASEFLPISSTAHLRLAPALLGQPDPGAAFTAVVQLGTLAAVLIYYARDVFWTLPRGVLAAGYPAERRLAGQLVLATLPIVAAGLVLKPFIVGDARSLWVVASALIAVALVMIYAERATEKKSEKRTISQLGYQHALLIGCAQACALVPGVSRSGATIAIALLLGLARPEAARFSFLLSIPAIAGAGLFELGDALRAMPSLGPIVLATVVAAVSGYLSIHWLLRFLSRASLRSFAYYRLALGAVIFVLLVTHRVA